MAMSNKHMIDSMRLVSSDSSVPTTVENCTINTPMWAITTCSSIYSDKYPKVVEIVPLRCSSCNARLDIKKMKDHVIRCEHCETDNFISME